MARAMFMAERYEHGSIARYSAGCRCSSCRNANAAHTRLRDERARAAAAESGATTTRGPCPGPHGSGCPVKAKLTVRAVGGMCRICRHLLIANPLVDAGEVLFHLKALSRKGVGYQAAAVAAGVHPSILIKVLSGERRMIRERTASRVLAVTAAARAGGVRVPSGATYRLLRRMIAYGMTKTEIARRLGSGRSMLEMKQREVRHSTAVAVQQLWAALSAERAERRKQLKQSGSRIGRFVLERTAHGITQRRIA